MRHDSGGRWRWAPCTVAFCGVLGTSASVPAGSVFDAFSDNHTNVSLWAVRHTDVGELRAVERNQRLEFDVTTQFGQEHVAGYLGNGWAINPQQFMTLGASYRFAPPVVTGNAGLAVGFSQDPDPELFHGLQDGLVITYGQEFGSYYVTVEVYENGIRYFLLNESVVPVTSGTMTGSYNPATNQITVTLNDETVIIPNVFVGPLPSQVTFFAAAYSDATLTLPGSAMYIDNVSVSGDIFNVPPLDIADCNGIGGPVDWLGDGFCDDGTDPGSSHNGVLIDYNCAELDFDDGDCLVARSADILWRHDSGQVVIWLMDGTDRVGQGSPGTADPSLWVVEGIGDFNGDGNADILWRHVGTGQVIMWFMDGTQRIGAGSAGSANPNVWEVAGIGDFDGLDTTPTSTADILWRNVTTGQTIIWLMNGTQRIGAGSPGSVGSIWHIAGVGDFDGDGYTDILWHHSSNGQVFIWFVQGTQRVGVGSVGSANPNQWEIAGVANFDGLANTATPTADILWRHSNGRTVIWLQDGTQRVDAGSPGTVGLVWQIAGTGDFDGDGYADILWRNQSASGQVFAWFIQGTSRIGQGPLGGVPHVWQVMGTGLFDAQ